MEEVYHWVGRWAGMVLAIGFGVTFLGYFIVGLIACMKDNV